MESMVRTMTHPFAPRTTHQHICTTKSHKHKASSILWLLVLLSISRQRVVQPLPTSAASIRRRALQPDANILVPPQPPTPLFLPFQVASNTMTPIQQYMHRKHRRHITQASLDKQSQLASQENIARALQNVD